MESLKKADKPLFDVDYFYNLVKVDTFDPLWYAFAKAARQT
jgi:hypothetical protein